MSADLAAWSTSVQQSMVEESHCKGAKPPKPPGPPSPTHPPSPPGPLPPGPPYHNCTFRENIGGFGGDNYTKQAKSKEECCAVCINDTSCTVAVFNGKATCHVKQESKDGYAKKGYWACRVRPKPSL